MRASVRDLRNNFAKLRQHLSGGEEITVTHRGRPIARLLPPAAAHKPSKEAWERFFSRKPLGQRISKKETEAFWSLLRD